MNARRFFAELKRRNVYRAAVAYCVVGWLLIQVVTQVFPFFEVPAWGVRSVILIIVAGLPFALLFAWAFEITPEGVKRTEDVSPQSSTARTTGRRIDRFIIAVLAIIIALLVFDRFRPHAQESGSKGEKSIAVLPFDNFSESKEDAFFADGIQDDILTSLAKIRDLKVISRTSVMAYRGGGRNLREIAQALGVTNILEGSVRHSKDRVLVNVQLIDALNDRHLWADRFDRTLDDVISLQGKLATEIASALKAALSPEEKARVEKKPTENSEAYAEYLKGREVESRPDINLEYWKEAQSHYQRAVSLDPSFALARAYLAHIIAQIYHEFEPTPERARRAKAEAEEALRLDPNLSAVHEALADWYYWVAFDYEAALRELAAAKQFSPNDANIVLSEAAIYRRQGRWRESIAAMDRAVELDPRNAAIAQERVYSFLMLRDWPTARQAAGKALEIDPQAQICIFQRVLAEYFATSSPQAAVELLDHLAGEDRDGSYTLIRFHLALLQRNPAEAERVLTHSPRQTFQLPSTTPWPRAFLEANLRLACGDKSAAWPFLEEAARFFGDAAVANPNDASPHAYLGWTLAHLEHREAARREASLATMLRPESKDAVIGPQLSALRSLTLLESGEPDQAMTELERLLTTPAALDFFFVNIVLNDLKLDWQWESLRNSPRFQKMVSGPEPKTHY